MRVESMAWRLWQGLWDELISSWLLNAAHYTEGVQFKMPLVIMIRPITIVKCTGYM